MGLIVNEPLKSKMEGLVAIPLKQIEDERGAVLHFMSSDLPVFSGFGAVYFSSINPGEIKAWKRHRERTQHFTVPVGRVRLVFYDDRRGSSSHGLLEEFALGRPDQYHLVCVPRMLWYGFQAVSQTPALLANCIEKPYEPEEQEVIPVSSDRIPYTWPVVHE